VISDILKAVEKTFVLKVFLYGKMLLIL